MKVIPDTNICIAHLKGGDPAVSKHLIGLGPASVVMSAVVFAELNYGARKSASVEKNLLLIERFSRGLQILSFDSKAAEHYGMIRALLARSGALIGPHDLMIASTALAYDCSVATRNTREFCRVPGLKVQEW